MILARLDWLALTGDRDLESDRRRDRVRAMEWKRTQAGFCLTVCVWLAASGNCWHASAIMHGFPLPLHQSATNPIVCWHQSEGVLQLEDWATQLAEEVADRRRWTSKATVLGSEGGGGG